MRPAGEHRAVGSEEHDASVSLLHGCCAVCVVPWPCPLADAAAQLVAKDARIAELEERAASLAAQVQFFAERSGTAAAERDALDATVLALIAHPYKATK